jgi:RNA polymerase sigma-70 factor (ECF subfamily)
MQNPIPADTLTLLMEEAQHGDTLAFKKIIESHQGYAYAIAFRFLYDDDDADDVVQECFIRIWEHLQDFDPQTKFTTWMYKIVVNLCLDRIKVNKRRSNVFSRLYTRASKETHIDMFDLEQELSNKDIAAAIKSLADGLSEKQRMIFLLRDFQDLSLKEVADITGLSESAIKTNLFYARQHIRKLLVQYEVTR